MDKPTEKQMKYIYDLRRFRQGVPKFKGTTRKEASEFIQKYKNYPVCIDEEFFPDEGDLC